MKLVKGTETKDHECNIVKNFPGHERWHKEALFSYCSCGKSIHVCSSKFTHIAHTSDVRLISGFKNSNIRATT